MSEYEFCDPELAALAGRFGHRDGINPFEIGVKNSGAAKIVAPDGVPVRVLEVALGQVVENAGIATVHIFVEDVGASTPTGAPKQKLVLDVSWQTGRGGGSMVVDATQGTSFTVAGCQAIEVNARIVNPGPGSLVAGRSKRVEGVVQWGGSFASRGAYNTGDRVELDAAVDSDDFAIPSQARSLLLLTDDPTATITASMQCLPGTIGTTVLYRGNFTGDASESNRLPVVAGAESVSFNSDKDCIVTPVWELWP